MNDPTRTRQRDTQRCTCSLYHHTGKVVTHSVDFVRKLMVLVMLARLVISVPCRSAFRARRLPTYRNNEDLESFFSGKLLATIGNLRVSGRDERVTGRSSSVEGKLNSHVSVLRLR